MLDVPRLGARCLAKLDWSGDAIIQMGGDENGADSSESDGEGGEVS